MSAVLSRFLARGSVAVEARFTGVSAGDLAIAGDPAELAARRQKIHPAPWVWVRQVHGARVVTVATPDRSLVGSDADAVVTVLDDVPIAVQAADCGPVLLVGDGGQLGVAHAGWRGVEAGVLGATLKALRDLGATRVSAVVGPMIGSECYEFDPSDLVRMRERLGPDIEAFTSSGAPALDMRTAIRLDLVANGVDVGDIEVIDACTACSPGYFSHRARKDTGRQALVAWRTGPTEERIGSGTLVE